VERTRKTSSALNMERRAITRVIAEVLRKAEKADQICPTKECLLGLISRKIRT
jgi:hypothetical protein